MNFLSDFEFVFVIVFFLSVISDGYFFKCCEKGKGRDERKSSATLLLDIIKGEHYL